MTKEDCRFCFPNVNDFPHLKTYGLKRLDLLPIAESDNFKVKPDILPANPDGRHFLVFPKKHLYNFASIGGDQRIICELGSLIYNLEQRFGSLVIFEHGGIREGNNNQSVYHAHFHAIGGLEDVDIISYMIDMISGGLNPNEIYPYQLLPAPNYDFLSNLTTRFNGFPYLYVEQGTRALYIEDRNGHMKSQVTQRSMNLFFSGKVLDWKRIPEVEEFARESARRLANIYELCVSGKYMAHDF